MDSKPALPQFDQPQSRWVWISGWGIRPQDFGALAQTLHPAATHQVLAPSASAVDEALALKPDVLAGYSLGALLVLSAPFPATIPAILGVAPILAFDAEAGHGGTTPGRSRLAVTVKFDKDPLSAIRLYLRLAGMGDCFADSLPYAKSDLRWGLDALGGLSADPNTVARARLFAGQADPLTDANTLTERCPDLQIIAGCGHDYRQLLPAMFTSNRHAGF